MNIEWDQPCPRCDGYTFEPDTDYKECTACLGYGDFAQGVVARIQQTAEQGGKYDDPIMQLVAQHILKENGK